MHIKDRTRLRWGYIISKPRWLLRPYQLVEPILFASTTCYFCLIQNVTAIFHDVEQTQSIVPARVSPCRFQSYGSITEVTRGGFATFQVP